MYSLLVYPILRITARAISCTWREVRAIRADLPVGVASGFVDDTMRARASEAGVHKVILKANAVEDLCEAFARLAQPNPGPAPSGLSPADCLI